MGYFSRDALHRLIRAAEAELAAFLSKLVPIDAVEITDAAAAGAATLKVATATVAAPLTWTAADLIAGGKTALATNPRRVQFTTAGATPANAPATALVTGLDVDGNTLTETVTLAQTAAAAATEKFFSSITSIAFPAADGTAATIAVGFTAAIGFPFEPKLRNGAVAAVQEFTNGVPSGTRGTYIAPSAGLPYGGVTFNTAPNGSADFTVYLERA